MQSIRINQAPNVVPGMQYNLERFEELYNWVNALQMDSVKSAMQPYGFGLLAYENPKTDFQLTLEGHQLQLSRCCGITKNGSIIGVFEEVNGPMRFDTKALKKDGTYIISIAVDSQKRQAIGIVDDNEIPLRQPFSLPSYHLELFLEDTKDVTAFPNALQIGFLKKEGNAVVLNNEFIPPVKDVGASEVLFNKFLGYQKVFDNFYQSLIEIGKNTEEELNRDMVNLRQLALQLGNYISANKWIFDLNDKATPLQLFNFCKSFCNILHFNSSITKRRTELVELMRQNVFANIGRSFNPQSFDDAITSMINTQYNNHYDIATNLKIIDNFIEIIYKDSFELLGKKTSIHPYKKGGNNSFIDDSPSKKWF